MHSYRSIGCVAYRRTVAGALLRIAQSCASVSDSFLLPASYRMVVPPSMAKDTVPRGDGSSDLLEAFPGFALTGRGAAPRTAQQADEALNP